LSALGLALYGILRLSYFLFYVRLRTTPEEVGYSYSRILAESLIGELVLVAALSVLGFAVLLLVSVLAAVTGRDRRRQFRFSVSAEHAGFVSALIALTIVVIGLPVNSWWLGGQGSR